MWWLNNLFLGVETSIKSADPNVGRFWISVFDFKPMFFFFGTRNGQRLFLVPLKGGRWHIIPHLAVYTTYILPSGGLYNPYHLLGEQETTIEMGLIFHHQGWKVDSVWLSCPSVFSLKCPWKKTPNLRCEHVSLRWTIFFSMIVDLSQRGSLLKLG